MARFALCLALTALSGCLASSTVLSAEATAREQALESVWSQELAAPTSPETKIVQYKSPIQRVVSLLKKMKAELEAEADKESEMYDKMVCWCETNEKEKTKAIADADAKDKELQAEIEIRAARFGELATEIAHMKEQLAADQDSLKQAMGIREGEAGEFRGQEKELVQAINNLRNAIAVLSKHHEASSLLQLDAPVLSSVRAVLRDVALKYEMLLGDKPLTKDIVSMKGRLQSALVSVGTSTRQTSESDRKAEALTHSLLAALDTHNSGVADVLPVKFAERTLAEAAEDSAKPVTNGAFLQAGDKQPYYKSYSPRSGVIFGILNQLKEEFEAQLSTSQSTEGKGKGDYEGMSQAKEEQVEVGKKKLDDMEGEHSENQKALSDAKEDLDLTRKQRTADVEFLRNLKLTCQGLDKQWELRSKTRSQEILAVAETLTILTEDDAQDLMAKSVTLLQEHAGTQLTSAMRAARSSAASVLRRAAQEPVFDADDLLAAWRGRKSGVSVGAAAGPRVQLSTLAVTVQLDAFTKVKEAMDKMVAQLKAENQEEVKFKAFCDEQLDQNEKATYVKTEEKEDLEMKIDKLAALMKKLAEDIDAAKKQIADTKVEVKKASESREQENSVFQTTVADQRATQEILKKAIARLRAFYKKEGAGNQRPEDVEEALVQQTPPVQFNKFKKNAGASPVMGLITQIIEDSKQLEDEAVSGEAKAQADYEAFVKDSNALIAELSDAITAKTKAIAGAKVETADAEGDHESALEELESLAAYNADLHGQCDFVLKNFEIRQRARLQEMEAIQEAKGILAGAMS